MKDMSLDVPGTTRLLDERGELIGAGEITLVPKPSGDPEDPLNWSRNRKLLHLLCILLRYTAAGSYSGACLYSILDPLSTQTGLTLDQLNQGTGYQFLAIGFGSFIFQPAALAFGKRPIYILSSALTVPVMIWMLYTQGNGQWIANRLVFGIVNCLVYTLVKASIADVFYFHQRAWPLGGYLGLSFAAAFFAPVVGGAVYVGSGWKPVVWIPVGFQALTTVFLIFFLEESNFKRRRGGAPLELMVDNNLTDIDSKDGSKKDTALVDVQATADAVVHENERLSTAWPGPRPLKFAKPSPHWAGIIVRGFLQPWALLPVPIILWSGILVGLYQALFSVSNALPSGIFSAEPYNMDTKAVGLTFLAPLLSTIPSSLLSGFIADGYTVRKARRNGGISEPEHKLDLFIVPATLTPLGLLMMGLGPYYGVHWIVYAIGAFLVNLSGPFAITLSLAYTFDCYHSLKPSHDGEVQEDVQGAAPYLLALVFYTMVIVFAFSYAITPWAFDWGLKNFAISSALITIGFNLSVLPFIKWGKSIRRWSSGYYVRVISF